MVGPLPSERRVELAVGKETGVGGARRGPLGQALAFGAITPEEFGGDFADEELRANHRAVGPVAHAAASGDGEAGGQGTGPFVLERPDFSDTVALWSVLNQRRISHALPPNPV